jgi:hypothetical protein
MGVFMGWRFVLGTMRHTLAYATAGAGMALMVGSVTVFGVRAPPHPDSKPAVAEAKWTQANWPFPLDQWGVGKAFVCAPADCGAKIDIYIRPKIGFGTCDTGVSDETELERIADTDLISSKARPVAPAHPNKVGWMNGLSRFYAAPDVGAGAGAGAGANLLSLAFNNECDVVVASATTGIADPAAAELAVLAFLNGDRVMHWTRNELGLAVAGGAR